MRKRFEWKWEQLDSTTERAQVIGGWIIRSRTVNKNHACESMTFVPDRDHEYCILQPIEDRPPENKTNPADFKSTV